MNEKLLLLLKGLEFKRFMEKEFLEIRKKYDLKTVEIEVLCYLTCCQQANTPTDIYRHLRLNRGHISQAIDRLYRRGYLLAEPDMDDRRIMHYTVNAEAEEVVKGIAVVRREMDVKLFEGVSEEEIQVLLEIMGKIGDNIRKSF